MTRVMWHVTCDTWHVTCDLQHVVGVNILSKFQLPSSYSLGKTVFWKWVGKGWLTRWINSQGVCITAPATPHLLKIIITWYPGANGKLTLVNGKPTLNNGKPTLDNAVFISSVGKIQLFAILYFTRPYLLNQLWHFEEYHDLKTSDGLI